MLTAGIGAAVLAGGGYLGYTQFIAGSSGPKATVRKYLNGVDNGNQQKVESVVAENGTVSTEVDTGDSISIQSMSLTVTEQTDKTATVEAEITTKVSMRGRSTTDTSTRTYELRKIDGSWKIMSSQ